MKLSVRRSSLTLCAILLAALCTSGCLQLRFERDTRLERVPKSALAALAPGSADLDAVLDRLGPPLYAWALPGQGAALAWGWQHSAGWQFKFSVPFRAASVYLDYGSEANRMPGAVFFFDADWKLLSVREGSIRDLREQTRLRPEDSEAPEVKGGD